MLNNIRIDVGNDGFTSSYTTLHDSNTTKSLISFSYPKNYGDSISSCTIKFIKNSNTGSDSVLGPGKEIRVYSKSSLPVGNSTADTIFRGYIITKEVDGYIITVTASDVFIKAQWDVVEDDALDYPGPHNLTAPFDIITIVSALCTHAGLTAHFSTYPSPSTINSFYCKDQNVFERISYILNMVGFYGYFKSTSDISTPIINFQAKSEGTPKQTFNSTNILGTPQWKNDSSDLVNNLTVTGGSDQITEYYDAPATTGITDYLVPVAYRHLDNVIISKYSDFSSPYDESEYTILFDQGVNHYSGTRFTKGTGATTGEHLYLQFTYQREPQVSTVPNATSQSAYVKRSKTVQKRDISNPTDVSNLATNMVSSDFWGSPIQEVTIQVNDAVTTPVLGSMCDITDPITGRALTYATHKTIIYSVEYQWPYPGVKTFISSKPLKNPMQATSVQDSVEKAQLETKRIDPTNVMKKDGSTPIGGNQDFCGFEARNFRLENSTMAPVGLSFGGLYYNETDHLVYYNKNGVWTPIGSAITPPLGGSKQILTWYPDWKPIEEYVNWLNIDFSVVTTVALFGLYVADGTGAVEYRGGTLDATNYPNCQKAALIAKCHQNNVKCLLTLRDNDSDLAYDPTTESILGNSGYITTLVNNVVAEVVNNGFDGVCMDLEEFDYNTYPAMKTAMTSLMQQLSAALWALTPAWAGISQYEIHLAVGAGSDTLNNKFDISNTGVNQYLNYIDLMNYDFYGSWYSPIISGPNAPIELEGSDTGNWPAGAGCKNSLQILKTKIDKSKIISCLPWYGKVYNVSADTFLAVANSYGGEMAYKDYIGLVNSSPAIGTAHLGSPWQTPYYYYSETGVISNGTFAGNYAWATHQGNTPNATFAIVPSSGGYTGGYASISCSSEVSGNIPYIEQIIEGINTNKTYILSGYMKVDGVVATSGGACLAVQWFCKKPAGWQALWLSFTKWGLNGTHDWAPFSLTFAPGTTPGTTTPYLTNPVVGGVGPDSATIACIQLSMEAASGTAYFSNIVFDEVPTVGTTYKQLQHDDLTSLGIKMDLANVEEIAGIAIWEASQSGTGSSALYQQIRQKMKT